MSKLIKDLGAVSAYAYAVEKGYTGTEEEYAELMASYASVAEEAAESAESAQASATTANSAASTATNKASEATTAAQTATAKAEEAQADADAAALDASQALSAASTATSKASEAAQSASDAVTAKTAAQTAQASAESARDDAESARDEAQQSAQTATEKASEASQSASDAQIAKTASETAKGIAESARDDAESARDEAQQSATTATTKAQEASQKASESSQSASAASGYATQAGQAKTAAETAQGLAEQAQTGAETAQGLAEDARDEAQTLVDSITGKVEQIDSNTDRIESLEDDRYKPYPTDTASGAIASFTDGAYDIPLKSLVVDINPVQDLHGQDAPYPAGGGKNKLDISAIDIKKWQLVSNAFKTRDDNYSYITITVNPDDESVTVVTSGTYMGICIDIPSGAVARVFSQDGTAANMVYLYSAYEDGATKLNDSAKSCSIPAETSGYAALLFYAAGTYTVKLQLEDGSSYTSWSPYENICPISGWTGANVSHSGADTSDATVYSITFPSEVGTVYGGTLDVTTGVLMVDRANIASYNGETLPSTWISDRDAYAQGATPTTGAQVVYELATPITLTLTPTEIKSLLGDNNLWADTGDTTAVYRADTTLYINRKIAEAVSALT